MCGADVNGATHPATSAGQRRARHVRWMCGAARMDATQ
jgi:hypothetical protein